MYHIRVGLVYRIVCHKTKRQLFYAKFDKRGVVQSATPRVAQRTVPFLFTTETGGFGSDAILFRVMILAIVMRYFNSPLRH
jgi:hypothetical protein